MDLWDILLYSLWDEDHGGKAVRIHGSSLSEWLDLAEHDYDDIDRAHYTDAGGDA